MRIISIQYTNAYCTSHSPVETISWDIERVVCDPMMVVVLSGSMRAPWGLDLLFLPLNAHFARNPGAVTHLLTCLLTYFTEYGSLCSLVQVAVLSLTSKVFKMDWGALRFKQRFAAEIRQLEVAGSDNKSVRSALSELLRMYPEIRELWPSAHPAWQSICFFLSLMDCGSCRRVYHLREVWRLGRVGASACSGLLSSLRRIKVLSVQSSRGHSILQPECEINDVQKSVGLLLGEG